MEKKSECPSCQHCGAEIKEIEEKCPGCGRDINECIVDKDVTSSVYPM